MYYKINKDLICLDLTIVIVILLVVVSKFNKMNNLENGNMEGEEYEVPLGEYPDLQNLEAGAKALEGNFALLGEELPSLAANLEAMPENEKEESIDRIEQASKNIVKYIKEHQEEIAIIVGLTTIAATFGGAVSYVTEWRNEFDGGTFSSLNVIMDALKAGGVIAGFSALGMGEKNKNND